MQTTSETNVSLNAPFTIQRFFLSTSEWHKLHYELSTYPWSTQLWGGLGLHKITVFYLVVLIKTEKLKLHSWRFVGTASRNVWYNLICKFQTKQFESGSWKIMFPLTFSLLFNSFFTTQYTIHWKKVAKTTWSWPQMHQRPWLRPFQDSGQCSATSAHVKCEENDKLIHKASFILNKLPTGISGRVFPRIHYIEPVLLLHA